MFMRCPVAAPCMAQRSSSQITTELDRFQPRRFPYGTSDVFWPAKRRSGAAAQAVDPVPFPERGKADTRSGKGTGSTACRPRLGSFSADRKRRTAQACSTGASPTSRAGERRTGADAAVRDTDASRTLGRLVPAEPPLVAASIWTRSMRACAVRVSRRRRERAQAPRIERWVRCLFWPACLPFRGPERDTEHAAIYRQRPARVPRRRDTRPLQHRIRLRHRREQRPRVSGAGREHRLAGPRSTTRPR